MNQANGKKRREGTAGVKALIASASIAATIAGWALLPSNDPTSTSAAGDTPVQQPVLAVPDPNGATGATDNGPALSSPDAQGSQDPSTISPDSGLPQVQPNWGFSNQPAPIGRTHSSR
ncbi:MAG: hypothetical protein ACJ78Q_05245 [Chloroflexia bacterium]